MDEIGAKVKAAALAVGAGALGVLFAPWLIKAAIIAVFLLVLALVAAARATDMSVFEAACLYGGKAIVALSKALAVCLVELPIRLTHRVAVRYDLALKTQVAVMRLCSLAGDQLARVYAWASEARAPRPALRLADPPALERLDDSDTATAGAKGGR